MCPSQNQLGWAKEAEETGRAQAVMEEPEGKQGKQAPHPKDEAEGGAWGNSVATQKSRDVSQRTDKSLKS